jgi:hypothetical protein
MDDLKLQLRLKYSPHPDRPDEPETQFYRQYLDPAKSSAKNQLTNFIQRVISRAGYALRKKTVSQKVPADWRAQAEKGADEIRNELRECDVIVNADQTFINFFPEADYVVAPRGAKRVGTVVSSNEKAGCTLMVTVGCWIRSW